jgi:hypothetical protein
VALNNVHIYPTQKEGEERKNVQLRSIKRRRICKKAKIIKDVKDSQHVMRSQHAAYSLLINKNINAVSHKDVLRG